MSIKYTALCIGFGAALVSSGLGQENDSLRMPWLVGQDVYAASKTLRKLGATMKYEQAREDTADSMQFFVVGQSPDSGVGFIPGQEVLLRFNCTSTLRYWDDYVVPLLGDFKHIVSLYRATGPPQPIRAPQAGYPPELLKFTFSGEATVEALVDYDGSVLAARVMESSGYEQADSAALDAAMQATFTSPENYEQPVRVWFPLPYTWQYEDVRGLPPMNKEGTSEGE